MSDIIWTKHAAERNKERQITQDWIEKTINNPDDFSEIEGGKIKSNKNFGQHTVTVITTKADSGKYLILSAWINPPVPGTADFKKENQRRKIKSSSGIKKIWLTLLSQLGF